MSKFKTYNWMVTGKLFSDQVYWTGRSWEKSIEKAQRYSDQERAKTVVNELKKSSAFNLTKYIKTIKNHAE
jgi:hypothetical protein